MPESRSPDRSGTQVRVHLWRKVEVDCHQVLDQLAVNVDFPITVEQPGEAAPRTIAQKHWSTTIETALNERPEISAIGVDEKRLGVVANEILIACRVPFEDWDFSDHLRGQTWLWLLKGHDGEPSVRVGCLALERSALVLTGAPWLAALLLHRLEGNIGQPEALKSELVKAVEWGEQQLAASKIFDPGHEGVSWGSLYDHDDAERNMELWLALSAEERNTTVSLLRSHLDSPLSKAKLWFDSAHALRALRKGRLASIERSVRLVSPGWLRLARSDASLVGHEAMAVCGVRLGAGLVRWQALEGKSEPVALLHSLAGSFALDIRGRQASRIGANRLWLEVREADDVLLPFYRGLARTGAQLASAHGADPDWRKWLMNVLSQAPENLSRLLWEHEASNIASAAGYLYQRPDGTRSGAPKAGVPKECLAWIPEQDRTGRPSLVVEDKLNQWLLGLTFDDESKTISWSKAP